MPVSKVGGLSIPLDSPAKETLLLLHKNGYESLYIQVWPLAFFFFSYFPIFMRHVFLFLSLGTCEVEAALDRMIDRCQSGVQGSFHASAEELVPLLGLTDRESAVKICGLYSKVETFLFLFLILV